MRDVRIVFMGTPDFAVGTLRALLNAKFNVVGVVTAPDKPAGRGRKIQQSAVKEYALTVNLKVLQPTNLKDESFLEELKELNGNLQIVVAFRMLPKVIWQLPVYGTFNLHASLLPNYRGAAPINWALINGEVKTGVTTFFIDEKIDTGSIILQKEVEIGPTEILGELHDKLMLLGSELVVETVKLIEEDKVITKKQPNEDFKEAPKLFAETCEINWKLDATSIFNLIRGLNPYPAAWTTLLNGSERIKVKLFDVQQEIDNHFEPPGSIIVTKSELKVATSNGFIKINSLQLAGKRKMDTKSLLNGYNFETNSKMI